MEVTAPAAVASILDVLPAHDVEVMDFGPRFVHAGNQVADTQAVVADEPVFDFFLPLKPDNDGRGSDLQRARHLIESINRFVDPGLYGHVIIAVPEVSREPTAAYFEGFKSVQVMSEFDIIAEAPLSLLRGRGWYLQQVLKLGFAALCRRRAYVTLDADCLFSSFVTRDKIERDGRLVLTPMKPTSWSGWWRRSSEYLGLPNAAGGDAPLMGITPQILYTEIAVDLIATLQSIAEASGLSHWVEGLQRREHCSDVNDTWTEYSLYWTYLRSSRDFELLYFTEKFYTFAHSTTDAGVMKPIRQQTLRPDPCVILQSSRIDVAAFEKFSGDCLRRMDGLVKKPAHEVNFHYYPPDFLATAFAGYDGAWIVSTGGIRMVALMQTLGCDTERLKHTTAFHRLPPDWDFRRKIVYVIVDPLHAVRYMLKNDQQLNMAKNSGINWPVNFCYGIKTAQQYAALGVDLFDLSGHFNRWFEASAAANGRMMFVKYEAIGRHEGAIRSFLELADDAGLPLSDFHQKYPTAHNVVHATSEDKERIRHIYKGFYEKISMLPDMTVR